MDKEKTLVQETAEAEAQKTAEGSEAEVNTETSEGATGTGEGTAEEVEEETGKKELVAVYPILFNSHQYNVGDVLPTNYPDMVQAWLEAGTAVWNGAETQKVVNANPKTAEHGLSGAAVVSESEDGDNLVGKVPKTAARKKK